MAVLDQEIWEHIESVMRGAPHGHGVPAQTFRGSLLPADYGPLVAELDAAEADGRLRVTQVASLGKSYSYP